MNILIFGVQGSGKSTIGKYTAEKLNIPFIATGDIFRNLREEGSSLGKLVKEKIDEGFLVPDGPTMEIVNKRLANEDAETGFVLDGAPRNLEQVKMLKKSVDLAIMVALDKNEALKRLFSRGRVDDTQEAINKRFAWYEEQTKPVISYYKDRGVKIIEIDNTPAEDTVRKNLDDLLKELKRD
ncbi:MAG: nucleoside monophosphate kinase [Candidatus Woykebacteria bacterium]